MVPVVTVLVVVSWVPMPMVTVVCALAAPGQQQHGGNERWNCERNGFPWLTFLAVRCASGLPSRFFVIFGLGRMVRQIESAPRAVD